MNTRACKNGVAIPLAASVKKGFVAGHEGKKAPALILECIRDGVRTSPEIAKRIGVNRPLVSVYLTLMKDSGLVRRGPRVEVGPNHPGGQPCIRWKLAEAAQ